MTNTPRISAGKRLARQAGYFIREHSEQKFSLAEIAGALYVNGNYLLTALASEYELKLVLGLPTWLVSILLTFGVSLAVGLMVARKNRHIAMVAALKTAE